MKGNVMYFCKVHIRLPDGKDAWGNFLFSGKLEDGLMQAKSLMTSKYPTYRELTIPLIEDVEVVNGVEVTGNITVTIDEPQKALTLI